MLHFLVLLFPHRINTNVRCKALRTQNQMTKIRITPFLIVNPIVIIWVTFLLIRVMNRDGTAVMMSGLFLTIIFSSAVLLFVDRLVVKRFSLWIIFVAEILLILVSIRLFNTYG